ncbi:hypothetical protein [Mycoplasma todarodis]|uniref:Rho termination factor N-terminal domain-containing protein n=1 Tax=Mycoplasma todarodis TaxID=1937191 RepID=A0A4R0XJ22_9MOLU|nr:hypothetical protein [Mycoplasma todarodis]TCG10404.1 hypothetical protein C4B25_04385 [Mycoplasma todarodis]
MKVSTLLFLIGATAIGVHLQSEEGEENRKKLKEQMDNLSPIVNDIFKKLEAALTGAESIKSDEIRSNVEMKVNEVKKTIAKVDAKKVGDATEEAIKVASKKIRDIRTQIETAEHYQDNYDEMTVAELKEEAKKLKVSLNSRDKKSEIISKLRKAEK